MTTSPYRSVWPWHYIPCCLWTVRRQNYLPLALVCGAIAGIISYRLGFLTASGSVMLFLLAAAVFGFGGIKWTIPILTFFILSSILSKISKKSKPEFDLIFEKGSRRDHMQVLANGGIGGLLVIGYHFTGQEMLFWAYLTSLAAATADTWATETGTMIGQTPRLITNFSTVEPGTSGGITPAGLAGALLGALVLAGSGVFYLTSQSISLWVLFALVVICGFLREPGRQPHWGNHPGAVSLRKMPKSDRTIAPLR